MSFKERKDPIFKETKRDRHRKSSLGDKGLTISLKTPPRSRSFKGNVYRLYRCYSTRNQAEQVAKQLKDAEEIRNFRIKEYGTDSCLFVLS